MMKSLLSNRGAQILFLISFYFILFPLLPSNTALYLYSISTLIKEILMWFLPLGVFFFIAAAIIGFKQSAPYFIVLLFFFEGLSNFFSLLYTYVCAKALTPFLVQTHFTIKEEVTFSSLWHLPISKPQFWSADKAAIAAFILGLLFSVIQQDKISDSILKGKLFCEKIFTRIFSRLIPFFVLGCVAKMYACNQFLGLSVEFYYLILVIIVMLAFYLCFLFFLGNRGIYSHALHDIKSLLPAGIISFSSGCSLSTMPYTIEGSEKNLKDPSLASLIIPATTNIQQIGDCIVNSFLCFTLYTIFYQSPPSLSLWLNFAFFFTVARYATAAVIGGAIFLMLPIYEKCFHFSSEVLSIILALNVLLDPFVTSSNVIANGALCKIFENVWTPFKKRFSLL